MYFLTVVYKVDVEAYTVVASVLDSWSKCWAQDLAASFYCVLGNTLNSHRASQSLPRSINGYWQYQGSLVGV